MATTILTGFNTKIFMAEKYPKFSIDEFGRLHVKVAHDSSWALTAADSQYLLDFLHDHKHLLHTERQMRHAAEKLKLERRAQWEALRKQVLELEEKMDALSEAGI